MELLYLWIEDYKNIYQQGFNFSPLYNFEFIPDAPDENGKIVSGTLIDKMDKDERKKKEKFYKDFFGKGISNVTAIVGENGAGKSNLLEYLFKKEGNSIDLIILSKNGKIEIEYNERLVTKFKLKDLIFEAFERPLLYPIELGIPLGYLSTIFDNRILNEGDRYASIDMNTERLDSNYLSKEPSISIKRHDTQLQLQLLNSNYANYIPIKNIPKDLSIDIPDIYHIDNFGDSQDAQAARTFSGILRNYYIQDTQERFINGIYFTACFFYIKNVVNLADSICSTFMSSFNEEEIKQGGKNCFYKLPIKFIDRLKTEDENNIKTHLFTEELESVVAFLKSDDVIYIDGTYISIASLTNVNKLRILFSNLFELFSFSWEGISSGEMLFFTIFARIFSFLRKNYTEVTTKNKYLLIIDEGELGLHPQWQKKFLSHILKFLNAFEDKQIQLILTSHSPFLVSDLPKENVIFLEKENDTGKCKVSKLESMKHTFGANIHTLLTDSFFMKGGLVGEFAQNKIDEVIKLLDKPTLEKEEIEHCEMIISMVGEPIVKTMMQKLLNSKRLQKVDKHEIELEKLRKRIEELEKK